MKRLLTIIWLAAGWQLCHISPNFTAHAAAALAVRGAGSDSENQLAISRFKDAYRTLTLADEARDARKLTEAARRYKEALYAYTELARKYPEHRKEVIRFRIAYCDDQLEMLIRKTGRVKSRETTRPSRVDAGRKTGPASGNRRKRISSQEPEDLESIKTKAKALLKRGKAAKARSLLLKGLRMDPDSRSIRLLLGAAQCRTAKFKDAMYLMKQLVDKTPFDADAHVILGTAYFGLGRTTEARKEMKRALDLNPGLSEAHYNMAQIMLTITPADLKAALYHYKKSRQLGGAVDRKFELLPK